MIQPGRHSIEGSARPDRSDGRAPPAVRRIGLALAALMVVGALYLIAVRGEAMLVDLTTLAERFWCF